MEKGDILKYHPYFLFISFFSFTFAQRKSKMNMAHTKESSNSDIHSCIIQFICDKDFCNAISMIRKNKLQNEIAAIMSDYTQKELKVDNLYNFLYEYIDHGNLSYTFPKEGHSLTDILKELDRDIYPRREEVAKEVMRHFVFILLDPKKNRGNFSSEDLELFSFREVKQYVTDRLANREIQVTNPDEFNDPFDCLILSSIRKEREKLKTENRLSVRTFVEEMERIRVCCFASWDRKKELPPYLNTLMWAHYANSHKGICIKYSLSSDKLITNGIGDDYSISLIDKVIYPPKNIPFKDVLNRKECFLYKDKLWHYEHEYRLIHYDSNENKKYVYLPLSKLGLKIKAVYFGLNCSPRDCEKVKNALKEEKDVEFYNIGYDEEFMNKLALK